ncbi:MAG: twin-arginine translocase TatA/TatE family subunit [Blastocatellia bacterium]
MDLGFPEIAVILVIALLLFGPRKLPELGASLGKAIKGFKEGINGAGQKTAEAEQIEKP